MEPTPAPTRPTSCSESDVPAVSGAPSISGLSRIQQAILNVVLLSEVYMSFADIASELELTEQTVSRAMRDEKYVRAYQYFCIQVSGHKFGAVMQSLTNLAEAGSAPHQKMYFQLQGALHDKVQDKPPPRPEDDDMGALRRRQREIEREMRDRGMVDADFQEEPDA